MSSFWRRSLFALLVLALCPWAYAPVLASGWTGRDRLVLASLAPADFPAGIAESIPEPPPPLARASLTVLTALAREFAPDHAALALRLVQLALLLAFAVAVGSTARAALSPWLGADNAAWSGRATMLLVPLHPLAISAVGGLEAHALLLGSSLGATALSVFIRARQAAAHTSRGRVVLAFVLLGVAAASGRGAGVFAFGFALVEGCSARRHRPWIARLRTTATTFVIAAAVVASVWIALDVRTVWNGYELVRDQPATYALDAAYLACEKLGVLLLPGGTAGDSALRLVVLGALLLFVCHPAFVAARSAPRLWGWLAAALAASVFVALMCFPRVRVAPGSLAFAYVLLPAEAVLAVILAVGATALAGMRRWSLPLLLALAWAAHAHELGRPWRPAAARAEALCADARAAWPPTCTATELWIVDLDVETARAEAGSDVGSDSGGPDERDDPSSAARPASTATSDAANVRDLASLRALVPVVLHAPFERPAGAAPVTPTPADAPRAADAPRELAPAAGRISRSVHVRALDTATLVEIAREPEFDAARRAGLVLLLPAEKVPRPDSASGAVPSAARRALRLTEPGEAPLERIWRGKGSSPAFNFDPARVRAVRATALAQAATIEPPHLEWLGREPGYENGAATGVWLESEAGPQAWFDLGTSLDWLFAGRIARLWFDGELRPLVSAELVADPLAVAGDPPTPVALRGPTVRGDDWSFQKPELALPRALHGDGVWSLVVLDPVRLRSVRLKAAGVGDELRAAGAEAFVRRERALGRTECAWSLEYRVGSATLLRFAGRR